MFKSVTPWFVVLGATLFSVVETVPFVNGDVEFARFINDNVDNDGVE